MTKITRNPVTQNHRRIIQSILGPDGRICSFSKSMGPAMAIYNSRVYLKERSEFIEIWHGDVVLDSVMRGILERYARDNKLVIRVDYEHGNEVWRTDAPDTLDGMKMVEAIEFRTRKSEERIKDRLSCMGVLTPRGTEWKWYNKWLYKGPYRIGEYFYYAYRNFIYFPINCAWTCKEENTLLKKIIRALKICKKEFFYQRFEGGLLHFWFLKLHQNHGQ